MKCRLKLFLGVIFIISLTACKKEGCTDCNAVNFDPKAKKEDHSCEYIHRELLGAYTVSDSIAGPPVLEWSHRTYQLEIVRAKCSPNDLIFSNYAHKNNAFGGEAFAVVCQVENNTITVLEQNVHGNNVRYSSGYFAHDSIYFNMEYENEYGEIFHGKCFGIKN